MDPDQEMSLKSTLMWYAMKSKLDDKQYSFAEYVVKVWRQKSVVSETNIICCFINQQILCLSGIRVLTALRRFLPALSKLNHN